MNSRYRKTQNKLYNFLERYFDSKKSAIREPANPNRPFLSLPQAKRMESIHLSFRYVSLVYRFTRFGECAKLLLMCVCELPLCEFGRPNFWILTAFATILWIITCVFFLTHLLCVCSRLTQKVWAIDWNRFEQICCLKIPINNRAIRGALFKKSSPSFKMDAPPKHMRWPSCASSVCVPWLRDRTLIDN